MDTNNECISCGGPLESAVAGRQCLACLLELAVTGEDVVDQVLHDEGDPASSFLRSGVLPRFDDYVLHEEIARGGMGVVYRAEQVSLKRTVAIKMILAGQLATPDSIQRFRTEAKATAQLDHPGIVPIYEVGEDETQHFFSMKLIDGANLANSLGDFALRTGVTHGEAREQQTRIALLVSKVARALAYAHSHGVLHRDVKPSNILVDQNGEPHLTDFGLAKLTGNDHSGLTLSSTVLGSPSYMAPEQAMGNVDQQTTSADVYGLGAVLYELLTGRPPFVGDTAVRTIRLVLDELPVRPRTINRQIHIDLETIALRCLEKQPRRRYPSADALADDLQRFIRHEPTHARPVSRLEAFVRWCLRNPRVTAMAGLLLLSIVVGSGTALRQWWRAENANLSLAKNVEHLEWNAVSNMLQSGERSRALAIVASMLRENPNDWKAAMFAMSIVDRTRFPTIAAPPIQHPEGAELTIARLSPNGERIVTASLDRTARLWNASTSQLLFTLQHDGIVNWAEFSPDGAVVATGSEDGAARLFNAITGEPISAPLEHDQPVRHVYFSADGSSLLTQTRNTLSVYDPSDGTRRFGPLRPGGRVAATGFRGSDQFIFCAHASGAKSGVQIWDAKTGESHLQVATGPITHADINSNLTRLVTVRNSPEATVWDLETSQKLRTILSTRGNLESVTFSPDGENVAIVSNNHWARIWNTRTGYPVTPELSHYYLFNGVAFSEHGDQLLTWANDSLAQVWDAKTGERKSEPMRHDRRVLYAESGSIAGRDVFLTTLSHGARRPGNVGTGIAQLWHIHDRKEPVSFGTDPHGHDASHLSPNGKWYAIAKTSGQVFLFDAATFEQVCDPLPVKGSAWAVLFTPDSDRLITTTSRGQVARWSIPDGQLIGKPVQLSTIIQPAEISPDGKFFATGSTDGFVRLWSTSTGEVIWQRQQGTETNAVAFSVDHQFLASAGEDGVVRIWKLASGEPYLELKGHQGEVTNVEFSSDQRSLVSASVDSTARIWDIVQGETIATLRHRGEVLDASFSPDGSLVATGARDRTAVIWDVHTGTPYSNILLHEQAVRNVRFSHDGQRLLTLDFRGLRLWDVETGHPLSVPLPHILFGGIAFQQTDFRPCFAPDGTSVFLASSSRYARIWDLPLPPPTKVPTWFSSFLEAVALQRVGAGTTVPDAIPHQRLFDLRQELNASTDQDFYTLWAQKWLHDR